MTTRRGVGLGAFVNKSQTTQSYASHGAALRSAHRSSLQTQLEVFQSLLHNFAVQHGDKIRSNPQFRAEFARMCNAIGVDPLAGSNLRSSKERKTGGNSFWTQILGKDVNDFYFEVAGRVVEICRETREENGGLLAVADCIRAVAKGNAIGGGIEVSNDDIVQAVSSVEPLGAGFSIVTVGSQQFIRSVPKELNTDQFTVLEVLQISGFVTVSLLCDNLNWEEARAQTVIDDLVADGLVWVDMQCAEVEYWSPQHLLDDDG